ncbi:MAG: uncharacterized protein KVP18_004774 [Porospora cf. gigantea A]|uniref:uncharacterized protein n=1 Tax=Porospora cf. gigantea A TaxID=2853593 RepID=UPI003559F8ED|nr:MAG: hypothetical protein KVP18_004774 [Porospora cf. gigantea A]
MTNHLSKSEVASEQVVRLLLQYLCESGLTESAAALQAETGIRLSGVASKAQLASDIRAGRWYEVLPMLAWVEVADEPLFVLYEQVVLELLEKNQAEAAQAFLRESNPLQRLQKSHPHRVERLEALCSRACVDTNTLYEQLPRNRRRELLSDAIVGSLEEVPTSRLLSILGQAMRWQRHTGVLPEGAAFDVFKGIPVQVGGSGELACIAISRSLRYHGRHSPSAANISPDEKLVAVAFADGQISLLDAATGNAMQHLQRQTHPVLCAAFSADSRLLAVGDMGGTVSLWALPLGDCVFTTQAHDGGVTSVAVDGDSQVLSTGLDGTVRIHVNGRCSCILRGHSGAVNGAAFLKEGRVVSAGSDGVLCFWDSKSTQRLAEFFPPVPAYLPKGIRPALLGVSSFARSPRSNMPALAANAETLLVPMDANHVHVVAVVFGKAAPSLSVVQSLSTGNEEAVVATCHSAGGDWVYCACDDRSLYVMSTATGKVQHILPDIHTKDILGLSMSRADQLVTWGMDSHLHFVTP